MLQAAITPPVTPQNLGKFAISYHFTLLSLQLCPLRMFPDRHLSKCRSKQDLDQITTQDGKRFDTLSVKVGVARKGMGVVRKFKD